MSTDVTTQADLEGAVPNDAQLLLSGTESSTPGPEVDKLTDKIKVELVPAMAVSEKSAPEKMELTDVSYIIVDDDPRIRKDIPGELQKSLGISRSLGASSSVEGAIALVKNLVAQGKKLDLILLDGRFYLYEEVEGEEGRQVNAENASRDFTREFKALTEDPQFKEALKDVVIVLHSSDPDELIEKLQKISPQVVGAVRKTTELDIDNGRTLMPTYLAALLGNSGKVKEDEVVRAAQSVARIDDFHNKLVESSFSFLPRGQLDSERLLALVNKYRVMQKLSLLSLESTTFTGISQSVLEATRREDYCEPELMRFVKISPELLFAQEV